MTFSGVHQPPLSLFRRFPGAVLRLSPDGVVLGTNGRLERDLGIEVQGRAFEALLDPESSAQKWRRALRELPGLSEDDDAALELILSGSDTLLEPRHFSVLREEDGKTVWLFEHRSDPRLERMTEQVTEVNSELANTQRELLKERGRISHAMRELERSNSALDEFAHVISHDLRAPLRSISTYASWLEEDLAGQLTDEAREHLERLRGRAERMSVMIQGVLDLARAGRDRSSPEPVDVRELLEGVLELLEPSPSVQIEIAPGMPSLVTHRSALQQVFLNLIGNALRFARGEHPRIGVGVTKHGGMFEFHVQDNGPGIPAELQQRIWTLFHTLEPEHHAGGTGIGLAVVRKLVEAQGGRAWVASREGEGATFRFLWPAQHARRAGAG